jgi:hypothetical protein
MDEQHPRPHGRHAPKLFEHFDEDVHQRLRSSLPTRKPSSIASVSVSGRLTRFILDERARFDDDALAFDLNSPPSPDIAKGRYHLISKSQPEPGLDEATNRAASSIACRIPLGETLWRAAKRCRRRPPPSCSM